MNIDPDKKTELPPEAVEEAAEWLIQLQERPQDRKLRRRFDVWLAAAEANRLAWERTCRAWQAFGGTEPAYRSFWEGAPRLSGRSSPGRWARRRPLWPYLGIAAAAISLCLVVMAAPALLIQFRADHRTATAESRSITLQDGSTVLLAASSAIATDFSSGRREIVLLEGEAFFDVVPDAKRPFVVEANKVKVEVLGTAFDVEISNGVTSVALARGSVKASLEGASSTSSSTLVPGELLTVDARAGTMRKESISVEDIGGWRDGRLYVVNATIGSVVQQIQRYHPAWITVADPSLARQRVTGFYNLHDPDQALEALVEPYSGKVRAVSGYARIITRF
ncbi:FecR family protein [Rhizobiaceae bacterium BDR2-2]|uniref:FecR family protein n=1 Tax=Ectorhizobium quercum TaxID=2965071 RepID=A0AAE3SYM9_9HYPH|nr:FecR family protein [Ectorhizobium quercum]MCX8999715.1 FecR family protein [Ectorhizobium quercum]